MAALLPLRDDGFAVLSGDDPTAMRAMLAGADGVVSVASNVLPRAMRRLCDISRGGSDADGAGALDARLQPLFAFLGAAPKPIPLKALLARMQIGHGLRLPLTPLAPALAGDADRQATAVHEIEHACGDPLAA
jgi:4-hydroxy-tetrahydrodipicolinate synthase